MCTSHQMVREPVLTRLDKAFVCNWNEYTQHLHSGPLTLQWMQVFLTSPRLSWAFMSTLEKKSLDLLIFGKSGITYN